MEQPSSLTRLSDLQLDGTDSDQYESAGEDLESNPDSPGLALGGRRSSGLSDSLPVSRTASTSSRRGEPSRFAPQRASQTQPQAEPSDRTLPEQPAVAQSQPLPGSSAATTGSQPGATSPSRLHPSAVPASPMPAVGVSAASGASASSSPVSQRAEASAAGSGVLPDDNNEEVFRVKNLDTGAEYQLDKRYTIRDLNTGQLYVLDDGPASAPGSPVSPASPQRITELASGRQLSLEEFDAALGLHSVLQAAHKQRLAGAHLGSHRRTGSSDISDSGSGHKEVEGIGSADPRAKHLKPGQWLRKKFFQKTRLVGHDRGGDASGSGNSSPNSSVSSRSPSTSPKGGRAPSVGDPSLRDGGATAGPSGRGSHGAPVRVTCHHKLYRELTDLALIQELRAHAGVVWTMKFSRNGKYLATAGQDCVVRVWEIVPGRGQQQAAAPAAGSSSSAAHSNGSSPPADAAAASAAAAAAAALEGAAPPVAEVGAGAGSSLASRNSLDSNGSEAAPAPPEDASQQDQGGADFGCPVFQRKPYRVWAGHKQDVLELCWSRSQFLLSASMDKSVRLWHISMDECLRTFRHTDFVTSLDFHPADDKHFISGSIDGKVRVWNIPEAKVVDYADVHEMVTAVAFAPDGRRTIVGTMKGKCRFYQLSASFRLEYEAQIDVKNKRGKGGRGKKVTGLQFLPGHAAKLLITSNDSRVRLYEGFQLLCKYKGHHNRNTQIRASWSAAGDCLVCGSDDGWVYVWNTVTNYVPTVNPAYTGFRRDKNASYECFHAHDDIVTCALLAPDTARRGAPPTIAAQKAAAATLQADLARLASAAAGASKRDQAAEAQAAAMAAVSSAPAQGQVIVTAGYSGEIKVFENLGAPQWV